MRNRNGRIAAVLVFAFTFCLLAANSQEEKKKAESYSGVAMGTGGSMGGMSIQFDLRLNSYTSDEELAQLATLLKEKGQDALIRVLEKEDRGQLSAVGHLGNEIAVVRKRQQGTNTIITIVTARNMPFLEMYRSGRSVDYPFGFMQITLNEKGEGLGQIMAAAKLKFNKKKGNYEIESYGNQYIKAVNVRPWK